MPWCMPPPVAKTLAGTLSNVPLPPGPRPSTSHWRVAEDGWWTRRSERDGVRARRSWKHRRCRADARDRHLRACTLSTLCKSLRHLFGMVVDRVVHHEHAAGAAAPARRARCRRAAARGTDHPGRRQSLPHCRRSPVCFALPSSYSLSRERTHSREVCVRDFTPS